MSITANYKIPLWSLNYFHKIGYANEISCNGMKRLLSLKYLTEQWMSNCYIETKSALSTIFTVCSDGNKIGIVYSPSFENLINNSSS